MSRLYTPPYSVKYMKQKLQETLGEGVVISNINGKRDIITFNHTAAEILQEFYEKPRYDVKKDKERLIQASTALIKSDIIQKFSNETKEFYPKTESMNSLDTMISAILCPIQLGLAVQLHHQYGSRFLIDTHNAHGFCSL
ncbi:hypothetical protein SNE40_018334 [Patella caerulea]|uniref:Uncharacterized protein n=1 Tax=Patella caerulea TaxID=87958 RepID=A0AAN8PBB8_PATCE